MTILRSAMVLGLCSAAVCPVVGQIRYIESTGVGMTEPLAISGDGSAVVGYSLTGGVRSGFRWTGPQDGAGLLSGLAGSAGVEASAVSFDGRVAVGTAPDHTGVGTRAVRWHDGSVMDLGVLPGRSSARAYGVSADGGIVAGVTYSNERDPTSMRGFRWSQATGMQDLGVLEGHSGTYASGISADGSVVVGVGVGGPARPFRWTEATGITALAMPGTGQGAWVEGVSALGSTVIGAVQVGQGFRAAAWEDQSVRLLEMPGMDHSWASAVNGDGSMIVGHAMDFQGRPGGTAVLWDAERRMVDIESYAISMGLDVSGWELWSATGVSADGMSIVGVGLYEAYPGGWVEGGWIMTIPSPGGLLVLGGAFVLAGRRRR